MVHPEQEFPSFMNWDKEDKDPDVVWPDWEQIHKETEIREGIGIIIR